jgi:hypothetical protein
MVVGNFGRRQPSREILLLINFRAKIVVFYENCPNAFYGSLKGLDKAQADR